MPRKKLNKDSPVTGFSRVASIEGVTNKADRALLERIAKLEKQRDMLLGEKEANEKQITALEQANRQGALYSSAVIEIPTGKQVKRQVFDRYKKVGTKDNGSPIVVPLFKEVDGDTYYYKIDMPPCGDTCLKINGQEYYHGAVYELDIDLLRTVKDIVARTWAHDRAIHPGDENFYKRDPAWQQRNARAITRGVL